MGNLEKLVVHGTASLLFSHGCMGLPGEELPYPVIISPESPNEGDVLLCYVEEHRKETFDFYWLVNGDFVNISYHGQESKLSPAYTASGDFVECEAWTPLSLNRPNYQMGINGIYISEEPE